MSKIINVPGTTTFIPLNDVLDITIQGVLTEEERLNFPETAEDNFTIGISTEINLYVVTRYVTEEVKAADDEDDEDADRSSDDEETETREVTKTARLLFKQHPLNTGVEVNLLESQQYSTKDEKIMGQTDLRTSLYLKNLAHITARDEILSRSANIAPAIASGIDSDAGVVEVEEDDTVTSLSSSLSKSFDPDQNKLQEIEEFLQNDQDKQTARIAYLKKHYNKSSVRVSANDGFEFLRVLRENGLSETDASIVEDVIKSAVEEVGSLINV